MLFFGSSCLRGEILRSAAHGRHNTNLGFAFERNLQNVIAAHHLAVDKHIDMRPHLASLCQHAIAQSGVRIPKLIQGLADSRGVTIDFDLGAATGKFS